MLIRGGALMARIAQPSAIASRAEMAVKRKHESEVSADDVMPPRGRDFLPILAVNLADRVISGHLADESTLLAVT